MSRQWEGFSGCLLGAMGTLVKAPTSALQGKGRLVEGGRIKHCRGGGSRRALWVRRCRETV